MIIRTTARRKSELGDQLIQLVGGGLLATHHRAMLVQSLALCLAKPSHLNKHRERVSHKKHIT